METSLSTNIKILEQISEKRKELIKLASTKGLNNWMVLQCSQELDLLIFRIQLEGFRSKKDLLQYQENEGIISEHIGTGNV